MHCRRLQVYNRHNIYTVEYNIDFLWFVSADDLSTDGNTMDDLSKFKTGKKKQKVILFDFTNRIIPSTHIVIHGYSILHNIVWQGISISIPHCF